MGSLYNWVGRYNEALVEIKQALELDKGFGHAWWALGNAYALKGAYAQAIEAHKMAVEINPVGQWALGNTYAMAGQQDKALTIISALKASNITSRNAFGLALIYTSLGDRDEAFHWLDFQPPDTWVLWVRTWPEFEALRKDPRFIDFLKEKNLPPI